MNWHFLPVSRDRYESTKAELFRYQQRCAELERLVVQIGLDALQSSLRKNGYMQIAEADPDVPRIKQAAPQWSNLDHNLWNVWLSDYKRREGASDDEAKEKWNDTYGSSLPSQVLIY